MKIKHRDPPFMRSEKMTERIRNNCCAMCEKPKSEWTRRTDWLCCSKECSSKLNDQGNIRDWKVLRMECFKRDNFTCAICNKKEPAYGLIADHIIPIALGGDQWELTNLQTLCWGCNKIKTSGDITQISQVRRTEKVLVNGKSILDWGATP
jgi:5-methylcytosine-specific restriction endonuclease McrA